MALHAGRSMGGRCNTASGHWVELRLGHSVINQLTGRWFDILRMTKILINISVLHNIRHHSRLFGHIIQLN